MCMISSFLLGMWEWRSDLTTHAEDMLAYDWGREIMHRVTFRRWDSI